MNVPSPCDCGFDADGLEFCTNGIVYSDVFRRIIESPCECDCHSSVAAVVPIKPKVLPCRECRTVGYHKMDCTMRGAAERVLVAA